ncbi:hypothetical protein D9619_003759 [Psilocybe cf. subviscida]|uniref:Elongator complex protein 5 n=1 Tax=Psilocybe cf. subviscida TaxID=2480587 RepID=A0A8H5AXZ4_9AGAR|nr:hypothetical protein D9619_003759 [Psilocybe cf. subviscida]
MSLFQPFDLPEGIMLLISDELGAPGDFLLHRALASHLKDRKKTTAIVLSVAESLSRWKALAFKSNINLQHHLDDGSLEFVDVVDGTAELELRSVVDRVKTFLAASEDRQTLVILDDVSMLEWTAQCSPVSLHRFLRAMRSVTQKANATLVVLHHIVTPDEPDDLFRQLLQISTYHIQVKALLSGRSGAVSGEVSLHAGFSAPADTVKLVPRSMAMQYKLSDVGPEFFSKGTSGGVL